MPLLYQSLASLASELHVVGAVVDVGVHMAVVAVVPGIITLVVMGVGAVVRVRTSIGRGHVGAIGEVGSFGTVLRPRLCIALAIVLVVGIGRMIVSEIEVQNLVV
jgi:hypothetical protein